MSSVLVVGIEILRYNRQAWVQNEWNARNQTTNADRKELEYENEIGQRRETKADAAIGAGNSGGAKG